MTEIPPLTFFNFFVFLFIPFLISILIKKAGLPSVIGYILGGIALSSFVGNIISKDIIQGFAYFGILLLMFTTGLEMQFSRIMTLKKFIVLGGLLQLFFSVISVCLLSIVFGFDFIQALLIGLAFSSSSTSIVLKILQDKGEENSFIGELTIGILIFQDLAFIPFMILFTSLTKGNISFFEVSKQIATDVVSSTIVLICAYYIGSRLVPMLFHKAARLSREVLNLSIMIFIFAVAYVSTLFHIPVLVSIFVAGILVSQTVELPHIFSEIRPFRDILSIIFFIYMGMSVEISSLSTQIPFILVFTILVLLLKSLIVVAIAFKFRFHSKLATYLSFFLFHIDEDAFILITIAYHNGLFTAVQFNSLLSVVLLSFIVTPFVLSHKHNIYNFLRKLITYIPPLHNYVKGHIDSDRSPIDVLQIKNHVVICGYGRIGAFIGKALLMSNIPCICIDYNIQTIDRARREGMTAIYGDPSDIDILDFAEVDQAMALVIAIPNRHVAEGVIINAVRLNRNIVIISRVHKKEDSVHMKGLGAHYVIQPEYEASLSIVKKLLLLHKVPKDEIIQKLHHLKLEHETV